MEEIEENEPHVFIHVPPPKLGEKYMRCIVNAKNIKKFDYNEYCLNSANFKDKLYKWKGPDKEKVKCFILCAGESYFDVDLKIKKKRFPIPKVLDTPNTTLDSSYNSNEEQLELSNQQNIQTAKTKRKEIKKRKLQNDKQESENILNNYLKNTTNTCDRMNEDVASDADNNIDIREASLLCEEPSTSCYNSLALSQKSNASESEPHNNVARSLKNEFSLMKKKLQSAQAEAVLWKAKYECVKHNKQESNLNSNTDNVKLTYYDKLYGYGDQIELNDADGTIELLNNVTCNSAAYKDAFRSKKPIQVIKKLWYGVYDYESLAKRCVREQKDNVGQIQLSPKKIDAVEKEFYRYLRLENYPGFLIKKELGEINYYHHNAILCARQKKKKIDKERPTVDECIANLERQVTATPSVAS